MSLKAAIVATFLAAALVTFVLLRKRHGTATIDLAVASQPVASISAQSPVAPSASPLERATQEYDDAVSAMAALAESSGASFKVLEADYAGFESRRSAELEQLDARIAERRSVVSRTEVPFDRAALEEIHASYGSQILALFSRLAADNRRPLSYFLHTRDPASLLKYLTARQAEGRKYEPIVVNAHVMRSTGQHFVNIAPTIGGYPEARRAMEALLAEGLANAESYMQTMRKAHKEAQTLAAREIAELLITRNEMVQSRYSAPAGLEELAAAYLSAAARTNAALESVKAIQQREEKARRAAEARAELARQEAAREAERRAADPLAIWSRHSTGLTWRSASDEQRRALCRYLAAQSTNGCSEQFFYDAFREFYDDPNTWKEPAMAMGRLFDAASTSLPRSARDY